MSAAVSPAPFDRPARTSNRSNNLVYKSGPLYISSKGLGWKSWKRRWFILTRTSLVFFKNDPSTYPAKGGDMNLTLGGIDLNNSGSGRVSSVLVRAEKKLLTVLFPDGRAFTLKAETVEDVDEWKDALERALQAAPNASTLSNSPSFQTEVLESIDGSSEQGSNRRQVKSVVIGRPILLALEDIDGSPSFLEKALTFIETYGVGVEGILRQSADVEDVERRVREYEQGRNQFSPDEDAHVIGDCIKHVLRELPSSPVPTPCCTALLEANRVEGKGTRISSMKSAVTDSFPDPNRRLLQRILRMMRAVSAHTDNNRMTASAVAACMAPLLLRPLLAGECGLEDESEVSPDNASQLLAATAAANNAQSIVTTLLEEYDHIFEDYGLHRAPPSPQIYGTLEASETEGSSDEEDDEASRVMNEGEGNFHDAANDLQEDGDEFIERALSGTLSESSGNLGSDVFDYKVFEGGDSDNECSGGFGSSTVRPKGSTKAWSRSVQLGSEDQNHIPSVTIDNGAFNSNITGRGRSTPWRDGIVSPPTSAPISEKSSTNPSLKQRASTSSSKRASLWGLTSVTNKNANADVNDSSGEEELAIHRLEVTRTDLRNRIAKEAKGNAILQASLERRKQALHDRRLALEQDVARLQEQLQTERDLRAALEVGLSMSAAQLSGAQSLDSKTRAEVEEIAIVEADVARLKQKVAELHLQLNQQRQQQHGLSLTDSSERQQRVKSLQAQQKILQQELDLTLALCHHEKQKNENIEGSGAHEDAAALEQFVNQQRNALAEAKEALAAERARGASMQRRTSPPHEMSGVSGWRTLRPPAGPSAAGRQFAWRNQPDPFNLSDDVESLEHSGGKRLHADIESGSSRVSAPPRQSATASAALVELTTRLDFFKERRSQLMDQLNSLDPSLVPTTLTGHDLIPASPTKRSP
uniref:Rho-GAP domain-containing protein n=2 Tax=Physcomitrium patens TaxID=3218 RepID=A0A7I4EN77_PHYPA